MPRFIPGPRQGGRRNVAGRRQDHDGVDHDECQRSWMAGRCCGGHAAVAGVREPAGRRQVQQPTQRDRRRRAGRGAARRRLRAVLPPWQDRPARPATPIAPSLANCATQRILSRGGAPADDRHRQAVPAPAHSGGHRARQPLLPHHRHRQARVRQGDRRARPRAHGDRRPRPLTRQRAAALSKLLAAVPRPAPTPCCRATPATCRRPPASGPAPRGWPSSSSPTAAARAATWPPWGRPVGPSWRAGRRSRRRRGKR